MNELAEKGCANELCLDYVDGSSVAVDKYAIDGLEIIPLHIIIYEKEKMINEYTPYAESDIPEGFEIVEGNEVRVEKSWLYKEDLSDRELLNVAKKTAEKTAESIDFKNYLKTGDEVAYIKTGADGFWVSNVCYDICEAADGKKYAGIYVWETDILPTFIYFSLIPFVCWTVSFAVIVFAFRKRKLKNES